MTSTPTTRLEACLIEAFYTLKDYSHPRYNIHTTNQTTSFTCGNTLIASLFRYPDKGLSLTLFQTPTKSILIQYLHLLLYKAFLERYSLDLTKSFNLPPKEGQYYGLDKVTYTAYDS